MKGPLVTLILAILFNAFANILMKYGVKDRAIATDGGPLTLALSYLTNLKLMGGIAFFGIALVFYTKTLEKMNLSLAYPAMTSTGILIVTFWSILFFGERLNLWQWTGVSLIIAGLWLVNLR
jgi:multidrug transporter EmrE-like cation transporter